MKADLKVDADEPDGVLDDISDFGKKIGGFFGFGGGSVSALFLFPLHECQ